MPPLPRGPIGPNDAIVPTGLPINCGLCGANYQTNGSETARVSTDRVHGTRHALFCRDCGNAVTVYVPRPPAGPAKP